VIDGAAGVNIIATGGNPDTVTVTLCVPPAPGIVATIPVELQLFGFTKSLK
jgi:hypothetical protein